MSQFASAKKDETIILLITEERESFMMEYDMPFGIMIYTAPVAKYSET